MDGYGDNKRGRLIYIATTLKAAGDYLQRGRAGGDALYPKSQRDIQLDYPKPHWFRRQSGECGDSGL